MNDDDPNGDGPDLGQPHVAPSTVMSAGDLSMIADAARRAAMLSHLGHRNTAFVGLGDGRVARIQIRVMSEDDAAELAKCGRREE